MYPKMRMKFLFYNKHDKFNVLIKKNRERLNKLLFGSESEREQLFVRLNNLSYLQHAKNIIFGITKISVINQIENGKMMFIYQAQLAFKIWHNILPKVDDKLLY